MKKTVIVTVIILVAAIISTICFGVALGSTAMRDYWKNGSSGFEDTLCDGEDDPDCTDTAIVVSEQGVKIIIR